MIYVALLRGINVGGNNKVDMKLLKKSFESVGIKDVVTYINSGNIIFSVTSLSEKDIVNKLEEVILKDFNIDIKVLIRNYEEISEIISKLPKDWVNDSVMKTDVLFLDESINSLDRFNVKDGIDNAIYCEKGNAIFWMIDKKDLNRTGLKDIIRDKELYKNVTIRNVNTTRKIYELMKVT